MWTLFRNGGFPMFFVVAFGFVALAAAAYYAFRPNRRSLAFAIWMGVTTLFSTLMGTATDVGTTLYAVVHMAQADETTRWPLILVEGLAESMSPGIMGFALIAMTAFVIAVGKARDAAA